MIMSIIKALFISLFATSCQIVDLYWDLCYNVKNKGVVYVSQMLLL